MTIKDVELIEVIRTRLTRRGKGVSHDDPVREVVQYWTPDGELLAEVDQWAKDCTDVCYTGQTRT